MDWEELERIAVVASVAILIWQTRALRQQMARGEIQAIYDRYLELTKIELEDPTLHRMFLYGRDYGRLVGMPADQLHDRALSLLIFDQFAMLYNMSEWSLIAATMRWIGIRMPRLGNTRCYRRLLDRRRSVWEINQAYVAGVLTNPLLIRSWRDWGLGETWRGSEFHGYVQEIIECWERESAKAQHVAEPTLEVRMPDGAQRPPESSGEEPL